MFLWLIRNTVGTRNDRVLKAQRPLVARVNELEKKCQAMSEAELKGQTALFKQRLANGEPLDSIKPEAFAVVREASVRTLGLRHFDVQIIGGAIQHMGKITEMKTGEGKTLVATLPVYLNALLGRGVHVVTVNDYLAKRDAEWMGRIYRFLDLSVGVVLPGMEEDEKRAAYHSDVTYGQNNEFGFDYLRDNMKLSAGEMMQRGHYYAIVDEVDSILIDEARTPLIISGPAEDSTELYYKINKILPALKKDDDFEVELRTKQPTLTEAGVAHCERLLGIDNLYDPNNIEVLHHVVNALKAHTVMERDVDYVVKDGKIIIVDEFTGRLMEGRRWSNGLHQAVEAKEGMQIARENQTLASVTFQNYFRMYEKLAGMTGTADTESAEFLQIYNLEVIVIPTHKPMIRDDQSDQVFRTRKEKYDAVVDDIVEIHESGQPILVGTISIEQSEALSKHLARKSVPHNVLNAKYHEREAEIVAQAGRFGAVTISTNMAGRGTDIMLGGNPEFLAASETGTKDRNDPRFQEAVEKFKVLCANEHDRVVGAGGLFILGTERHEARRIDNQLRGRSGRQGDPGKSRFYVSLEDELMMRFGGERIKAIMQKLGWDEGMAIDGRLISRSVETAQKRVESYHFEIRKQLTEFDDVMNKQRQVIYNLRHRLLMGEDIRKEILDMIDDMLEQATLNVCDQRVKPKDWDISVLESRFKFLFNVPFRFRPGLERQSQVFFDALRDEARVLYEKRVNLIHERLSRIDEMFKGDQAAERRMTTRDGKVFFDFEQHTLLETLDHLWNLHLQEMDDLRDGIGLRGYGQKNPLHEYQREGFLLFQTLLDTLRETVVRKLFFYEVPTPEELMAQIEADRRRREEMERRLQMIHSSGGSGGSGVAEEARAQVKNPEEQRARLAAQKKARRKASGKR